MRRIALIVSLVVLAGCAGPQPTDFGSPVDLSRIAGWKGASINSPDAFRFVVASDRTGGHEPGVWERAIVEINRLKPDFVMCVGDLIEGYANEEDVALEQWNQFDELTRKLDSPFFYCPGNHDVAYGACRKVYTRLHGVGGKTYYSFDYRGCHFVVMDSTAVVNAVQDVADAQWAWLAKDLGASRGARHVFVFLHHPLYGGPHWQRLRKMLDPRRTTVFAGHYHSLSYDLEDAIPFLVLGRTAAGTSPDVPREKGAFQMFAHVTVSSGRPSISILPLGQVLPRDFISRALSKRLRAVAGGVRLTSITRAGGQVTLHLNNPTDTKAEYTLRWTGPVEWFAGGAPQPETVAVAAGGSAQRKYRIRPTGAELAPPALEVDYQIRYGGQPGQGKRKLALPVAASVVARRVSGITVDGDLTDWANVPARASAARWQVRDNPEAWAGSRDCSFQTRLGYDGKNLYVAVEVADETFWTDAEQTWYRDGIEVFWDPRPPAEQDGRLDGPCRQLLIPLPEKGKKPVIQTNPADGALAAAVRVAYRRRAGGYAFELVIPFSSVAKGFRPAAGRTLRLEIMVNDRDGEDRRATTCMVLSGDSDASRNTSGYAIVSFE